MSTDFAQKSYSIAHARHESVMNEARRMAKSGEYADCARPILPNHLMLSVARRRARS